MATITSTATGNWTVGATWVGGVAPTAADDAVIASGHTVTVNATSPVCRDCTVNSGGTLRASRSVSNTLTIGRNLIANGGTIDYGLQTDRIPSSVQARVLWNITGLEAGYVGGDTDVPLTTDPGLWVYNGGNVYAHGFIKETWVKLAASASAGATSVAIEGRYTQGWGSGDALVFSDTHARASTSDNQQEERTLSGLTGAVGDASRTLSWAVGLTNAHERIALPAFTDPFGDTWNEILAGEVANITKNVVFDTSTGTSVDAPHFMVLDTANVYLEDMRINNFSPRSTRNPMGRYGLHLHQQGEGSRGSYRRRTVISNSKGGACFVHESFGITGEDNVYYNVGTVAALAGEQISTAINLEVTSTIDPRGPDIIPAIAANDFREERALAIRSGSTASFDRRSSSFWMGMGSFNAAFLGCVATGHTGSTDSGGFVWPEPSANAFQQAHANRCEAHSCFPHGFFMHMNFGRSSPFQIMNDWLSWRNGSHGIREGAYASGFHMHHLRAIENRTVQLSHSVRARRVTNFLADPRSLAGAMGIRIIRYVLDSTEDSFYRDGIIRNVAAGAVALGHDPQTSEVGAISQVQVVRTTWTSISGTLINFGPGSPPPISSHLRIRGSSGLAGLGHGADFTIFRAGDPGNPGTFAANVNGDVVASDTANTLPLTPRCFLTLSTGDDGLFPAPDAQGQVIITATAATRDGTAFARPDAHIVDFYLDNDSQLLSSVVPDASGNAVFQWNATAFPHRRPYIFARARYTSGGNSDPEGTASRPVRARRAIGVVTQPEPTNQTLNTFTSGSPTTLTWTHTDGANELGYEYSTSPNGTDTWTVRGSTGENSTTFTWASALANTTYHGRVASIGPTGTRYQSNVIGPVTTATTAPAPPINARCEDVGTTTLNARITDNSTDETTWHMRFRTPPTSGTYGAPTTQATSTQAGTGATVTFAVSGLLPGTPYEFEFWASHASGASTTVTATTTTTSATPNPPTNLVLDLPTTDSFLATWVDTSNNETAFEIEIKRSIDIDWIPFSTTMPPGTTAVLVHSRAAGTSYDARVRARNGTVTSAYSNIATISTAEEPPTAPSNLVTGTPGTGSMPLTWLDRANNENLYHVEFKLNSEPSIWTVFTNQLPANTVSAIVTGLLAGRLYDFRVRCEGAGGNSGYSNTATESTASISPPSAPTGLTTNTPALNAMGLAWNDIATTEDAYHVEHRIQGTSVWTVFTTVLAANSISVTVTNLVQATPYEFRVRCALGTLNSDYSNIALGTTLAPPNPGTPVISSAVAVSPTRIDVVWNNVADESGYDLESSPDGAGTWTIRASFAADTTSGSWLTAAVSTAYDIRIVAFRGAIRSPSVLADVTTPASAPNAPLDPQFPILGSESLTFRVTDNSAAETAFECRYRDETDIGNPSAYTSLSNHASEVGTGTAIDFEATGLTPGRTYRFAARAIDAVSNSAYAESTITTRPPEPPPAPPIGPGGRSGAKRARFSDAMDRWRRRYWKGL